MKRTHCVYGRAHAGGTVFEFGCWSKKIALDSATALRRHGMKDVRVKKAGTLGRAKKRSKR